MGYVVPGSIDCMVINRYFSPKYYEKSLTKNQLELAQAIVPYINRDISFQFSNEFCAKLDAVYFRNERKICEGIAFVSELFNRNLGKKRIDNLKHIAYMIAQDFIESMKQLSLDNIVYLGVQEGETATIGRFVSYDGENAIDAEKATFLEAHLCNFLEFFKYGPSPVVFGVQGKLGNKKTMQGHSIKDLLIAYVASMRSK